MLHYEKPALIISEDTAEGIFMWSGVSITGSDGHVEFRKHIGSNSGFLMITNPDLAGKNGTVTFRVTASWILGNSSELTFNGVTKSLDENNLVSFDITGIELFHEYPIQITTGGVSLYSTSSMNEGGGEIYIEIWG